MLAFFFLSHILRNHHGILRFKIQKLKTLSIPSHTKFVLQLLLLSKWKSLATSGILCEWGLHREGLITNFGSRWTGVLEIGIIEQGSRYKFLLEGAMGKPNDELSDPEPWRGSRGTPLEKFESTLFKLA